MPRRLERRGAGTGEGRCRAKPCRTIRFRAATVESHRLAWRCFPFGARALGSRIPQCAWQYDHRGKHGQVDARSKAPRGTRRVGPTDRSRMRALPAPACNDAAVAALQKKTEREIPLRIPSSIACPIFSPGLHASASIRGCWRSCAAGLKRPSGPLAIHSHSSPACSNASTVPVARTPEHVRALMPSRVFLAPHGKFFTIVREMSCGDLPSHESAGN